MTLRNDDIALTQAQAETIQRRVEESGGTSWVETEEDGRERVHVYLPPDEEF